MTPAQVITKWRINKQYMADVIKMPVGTLKNKLSRSQVAYSLTEAEEKQLADVLRSMAADIKKIRKAK